MSWSRCTNGCDQAQSEHLHFDDSFVGSKIFRSVSVIPPTLRPKSSRVVTEALAASFGEPRSEAESMGRNARGVYAHQRI
jgi:hypothetical protein